MIYDKIIEGLEDDKLYNVSLAVESQEGFFEQASDLDWAKQKAKGSLAHLVRALPKSPDGYITVQDRRSLQPAWFGRTWKAAVEQKKKKRD